MTVSPSSHSATSWGSLPMEGCMDTAAQRRSQLLAAHERQASGTHAVPPDGSAVEQCDAVCAQSLLVLAHAWSARGRRLPLMRVSDALVDTCLSLGLGDRIASTACESQP